MPSRVALLSLFSLVLATASVQAQTPLYKKRFAPTRSTPDVGLPRGNQLGYNQCNSSTEGPNSLCQTAIINSLDDFCLWAPPNPGKEVGEIEGEMVAWCTKPGHGSRVIPDGTITGVQFTKAPNYIQTNINMLAGDFGGEMDPHGADMRGNPMGGLLYTTAWGGSYKQVIEWHNFMGADYFCLKACDPSKSDDDKYCEHIYDTQGCVFNAPSNAKNGIFESCASDNQNFPGQGEAKPPASSLCSTSTSSSTTTSTSSSASSTTTGSTTSTSTSTSTTSTTGITSTTDSQGVSSRTQTSAAKETSALGNAAGVTKQPVAFSVVVAMVLGIATHALA
ncbi:hypothetical protein FA13DRAFT_1766786 [Coprinellus micaceus]|uniref:Macrofage activating glyco protein n=1 Tax=Coprinellus micaceus TaxID=71717 RepID=A0A4Y7SGP1_COPMI|nr:hypothetical protein FA13DRAFT_1766786 [Coprinellus micaceus]